MSDLQHDGHTPTILAAIDGSERSADVLKVALDNARAMKARVIVYRSVLVPPEFPPAAATGVLDSLPAYLEEEARARLSGLLAHVGDVDTEVRVERGAQAWRDILAAADAADVDLIVLGSHGYHGWDRVLGTTAGKVANLAHRNVLIVHGRKGD